MKEPETGIPEARDIALGVVKIAAGTFALYAQTHIAHWNVVGPSFVALHGLFGDQYEELHAAVDDLMERARALGSPAPPTLDAIAMLSPIPVAAMSSGSASMLRGLLSGNEAMARACRALFALADKAEDQATCDLLAQRMRAHEKAAWKLRSLLEGSP